MKAFVVEGDVVYVFESKHPPSQYEPDGVVLSFIQSIYQLYPTTARKILRNRIFTTEETSPLQKAVVKICAKRIHHESESGLESRLADFAPKMKVIKVKPDRSYLNETALTHSIAFSDAPSECEFLSEGFKKPERHLQDRPVVAALFDHDHKLVDVVRNTNLIDRTQHAELKLLQRHFARSRAAIPSGWSIAVNLKPCKMCAAAIVKCAEDIRNLNVRYFVDDGGPASRNTALDSLAESENENGEVNEPLRHSKNPKM